MIKKGRGGERGKDWVCDLEGCTKDSGIFLFSIPSSPSHDCTLHRKKHLPRIPTSCTSTNAISCVLGEAVASPTFTGVSFSDTLFGPTDQRSRTIPPRATMRAASSLVLTDLTVNPTWREAPRSGGPDAVSVTTFPPTFVPGPDSMLSVPDSVVLHECVFGRAYNLRRHQLSITGWPLKGGCGRMGGGYAEIDTGGGYGWARSPKVY